MLNIKILPVTGFGKTAEFASISIMNYDLATKTANVTFTLLESAYSINGYILSKHIFLTAEDTANWGLDDMVLVDVVLAKEGLTRDTEWVEPTTTVAEPVVEETTTAMPIEETTTTTEPVVEETTTTTTIGE
jgi:hypothetical protein